MDSWFMLKRDGIKSKTRIPYQGSGANRDPNESVSGGSSAYRRMGLPVTPSIFTVFTSSVLTFLNVSLKTGL